jgi:hypothetical protein
MTNPQTSDPWSAAIHRRFSLRRSLLLECNLAMQFKRKKAAAPTLGVRRFIAALVCCEAAFENSTLRCSSSERRRLRRE